MHAEFGRSEAQETEFTQKEQKEQKEMSASHVATCQQQRVRQLTKGLMRTMFQVMHGPCQHSEFLN